MRPFLVRLVASAAGLAIAAWLFSGITVGTSSDSTSTKALTLLGVAAVFGLVNAVIKPVVKVLAFPFVLLTLGLLTLVINALLLRLTAWISQQVSLGFDVRGFWTAVGGALVVSIVSVLVAMIIDEDASAHRRRSTGGNFVGRR